MMLINGRNQKRLLNPTFAHVYFEGGWCNMTHFQNADGMLWIQEEVGVAATHIILRSPVCLENILIHYEWNRWSQSSNAMREHTRQVVWAVATAKAVVLPLPGL